MAWLSREWWWIVAIIAVCAFMAYREHQQRPAVSWDLGASTSTEAAPGQVGDVSFAYNLLRPCTLDYETTRLTLVDARRGYHHINQRSGVPALGPVGNRQRTITFEVPRFAEPGPADVIVSGTMVCGRARVHVVSPPIRFTVLEAS